MTFTFPSAVHHLVGFAEFCEGLFIFTQTSAFAVWFGTTKLVSSTRLHSGPWLLPRFRFGDMGVTYLKT